MIGPTVNHRPLVEQDSLGNQLLAAQAGRRTQGLAGPTGRRFGETNASNGEAMKL